MEDSYWVGVLFLLTPTPAQAGGPVGSLGAVRPHALAPGTNDLVRLCRAATAL